MQPEAARGVSYVVKHSKKALACAIGFTVCSGALSTAGPADSYKHISTRNIFGLKPPVVEAKTPDKPLHLPNITMQGITTVLGRLQVLFKVSLPAHAGEAAKEESYVLSRGESAGEVEVLEIDESARTAKFKNHGVTQTLRLEDSAGRTIANAISPPKP